MTEEEVDQLQSKALEQFRSGKSLSGKDGHLLQCQSSFWNQHLRQQWMPI